MTEADAIDVAAKHAEQQGWPWLDPVQCRRCFPWFFAADFLVRSHADHRGQNVLVIVDAVNGKIKDARFLKR